MALIGPRLSSLMRALAVLIALWDVGPYFRLVKIENI